MKKGSIVLMLALIFSGCGRVQKMQEEKRRAVEDSGTFYVVEFHTCDTQRSWLVSGYPDVGHKRVVFRTDEGYRVDLPIESTSVEEIRIK